MPSPTIRRTAPERAPAPARRTRRWRRPSLASLRLGSGLVLFAYATMHLFDHALGNISLDAIAVGSAAKEWIWNGPVGLVSLYGALLVHTALVVSKTLRRSSWRLPFGLIVQIASGLAVPALLLPHILATRGAAELIGVDIGYRRLLTLVWPDGALLQTLLLAVVWLHGCVGIHFWLRLKPWYGRVAPILGAAAVALATLSFSGFVSAARMVEAEAEGRRFLPLPAMQWIVRNTADARALSLLATGVVVVLVLLRPLALRLQSKFTVAYDDRRAVRASVGPTILEISRGAGIPHASACGGRARCSTCRVQILSGGDALPAPGPAETRLLQRIAAPPDVRLACQTRPKADLRLRLLVGASGIYDGAERTDPYRWGVEREIAVLFADLRGFTRLTERRLAYDVVHLLNAYFDSATRAIVENGGRVDKVMGDGLMALFAVDEPLADGAPKAVAAVRALLAVIDAVNVDLAAELDEPLRVAIGLHCGPAILGRIGGGGSGAAVTALGDTVNTASRLEDLAKARNVSVCVSETLAKAAGLGPLAGRRLTAEVRGRRDPVAVRLFADGPELDRALDRTLAAPGEANETYIPEPG